MDSLTNVPIPTLPLHAELRYVAEGAANIICQFYLPPASPSISTTELESYGLGTPPPTEISVPTYDPIFDGKLLRLRKDIPSRISNKNAVRYFKTVVSAAFSIENLVSQDLVAIPPWHIQSLNANLKHLEASGQRPSKRHGIYLATDEPHGILITDMRPQPESVEKLIEFKPKWLAQSPTAPKDARRCRTCALRDLRNVERVENGELPEIGFCPLDLVSRDRLSDLGRTIKIIAPSHDTMMKAQIFTFLKNDPLLVRLKTWQEYFAEEAKNSNDTIMLASAMTTRDCTVFLKIPGLWDEARESPKVEARLGDLDLKIEVENDAKIEKWKALEKRLIDEGWYAGKEMNEGGYQCKLERDAPPQAGSRD